MDPREIEKATRIGAGIVLAVTIVGSIWRNKPSQIEAKPVAVTDSFTPGGAAGQILRSATGIDDGTRAKAFDAYQQSRDEDELTRRLQNLALPQEVKAQLWEAKHAAAHGVPAGVVTLEPNPNAAVPATPCTPHYKFERNGASLWRYNLDTGQACQITASVAEGWQNPCPETGPEGWKR